MQVDQERLRQELARMKELIAGDPRVLARFDLDGNGVIDGQEWEAVRQVVVARLLREAREAELARQLLEELDEEQAAELARMEAEMEAEMAAEEEAPPAAAGAPSKGRDFSGVELAFDPREDRKSQRQSLADEIYERELVHRYAEPARDPRTVRVGEHGTLADRHELVLEQGGGVKQFFGNMFRREYVIRDARGEEIGRVGQQENEMLQNLGDYSIMRDPDLHFRVYDACSGEEFSMRRSSSFEDNSVEVCNPRGRAIADTSWTLSFVRRTYEVRVYREGVSYYVRRRLLKPWTFEILDPFEEPIGEMQRGWSGLGFLTGGNLFRVVVDQEVIPDVMWGLLAAALLADLDSEAGSRRSALDFFNE